MISEKTFKSLFTRLEKTTFLLVPPLKLFIHSMIFLSSIYHNSCSKILIFDRLCVYNKNPLVLCTKNNPRNIQVKCDEKSIFWWSERKKTNSRKKNFHICNWAVLWRLMKAQVKMKNDEKSPVFTCVWNF